MDTLASIEIGQLKALHHLLVGKTAGKKLRLRSGS